MRFLVAFSIVLFAACSSVSPEHNLDRQQLAAKINHSLRYELLQPWYPRSVDTVYGGFLSTFTYDFKPHGEQHKMIVSQARHTWVNAQAYKRYKEEPFRVNALHGSRFLLEKMWDHTYGGFYSLVYRDGKVADSSKTAYGNAFGIYALAGVYANTGDTSALGLARRTFQWLEMHSHDNEHKGYFQHLLRNGTPIRRTGLMDSRSETGYKDQNSSIHLLEAFTELYSVWPDPILKQRLLEMLTLIRDTMVTERGYLNLFFTTDWKPVSYRDSSNTKLNAHHSLDHVSFGHDIETAYLLMEAAHVAGVKADNLTLKVAKRMVDHTLMNGWDSNSGGIYDEGYYFKRDDKLKIIRDSKNWWAQAEALNTLLIMADMYPEDDMEYFKRFVKQWEYIDRYLIDHNHGDWFQGGIEKKISG